MLLFLLHCQGEHDPTEVKCLGLPTTQALQAIFMEDIVVENNWINDGWDLFSGCSFNVITLHMLTHSRGLLGHLNTKEPLLFYVGQLSVPAITTPNVCCESDPLEEPFEWWCKCLKTLSDETDSLVLPGVTHRHDMIVGLFISGPRAKEIVELFH